MLLYGVSMNFYFFCINYGFYGCWNVFCWIVRFLGNKTFNRVVDDSMIFGFYDLQFHVSFYLFPSKFQVFSDILVYLCLVLPILFHFWLFVMISMIFNGNSLHLKWRRRLLVAFIVKLICLDEIYWKFREPSIRPPHKFPSLNLCSFVAPSTIQILFCTNQFFPIIRFIQMNSNYILFNIYDFVLLFCFITL